MDHPGGERNVIESYAYSFEVQSLLSNMVHSLITHTPDDPVKYMIEWLQQEEIRRKTTPQAQVAN
eukprot:jgi/Chlat1/755/Chrsp104S01230